MPGLTKKPTTLSTREKDLLELNVAYWTWWAAGYPSGVRTFDIRSHLSAMPWYFDPNHDEDRIMRDVIKPYGERWHWEQLTLPAGKAQADALEHLICAIERIMQRTTRDIRFATPEQEAAAYADMTPEARYLMHKLSAPSARLELETILRSLLPATITFYTSGLVCDLLSYQIHPTIPTHSAFTCHFLGCTSRIVPNSECAIHFHKHAQERQDELQAQYASRTRVPSMADCECPWRGCGQVVDPTEVANHLLLHHSPYARLTMIKQ